MLKLKLCTFDQVPGPGSRSKYTNVQTSYAYVIDTALCNNEERGIEFLLNIPRRHIIKAILLLQKFNIY